MKKCWIDLVEKGKNGNLYALHYENQQQNVLMQFLNDPQFQKMADFNNVVAKIDRMVRITGLPLQR